MRGLLRSTSVAIALLFPAASPCLAESTVLTVSGAIGKTNREAFDPFFDGFLKFHDKTFDKAYTFDWDALAALPQQTIKVNADTEDWPRTLAMEGPLLRDVLATAEASGKTATLYALDGFGFEMGADKMASHDWILAMKVDGKPLGIGGFGPLWLVYDTGGRKAPEEEERSWVWSVFHIEVE
ncbi:hypothetical protein SAMN05216452_3616 [Nitratireductor aquibiodomus]|uniref:Oxidoreductase molybdopterin-binding domain-containing protein n=1 Tax=Nitratireductor aquibiodomus TaxID=204799 RepID=A0A1H4N5L7_9HYPH|nr:hypothetical protein [Nitratireductor aquibiodomus]SEB90304.1 hypothetical protein SAMN05216452_3616 [Nitratireductor aquibiodomus]